MTSKRDEAGFDDANKLEEGRVEPEPKSALTSSTTWSAGSVAAHTFRSSRSILKKALSWGPDVSRAVLPKTSSSKAECKTAKLEDFPLGYPRVSCLLDSDESFMIYRRFGRLHSRLLLHKQDQLRGLEEELLVEDQRDERDPEREQALRCREDDDFLEPQEEGRTRKEIFNDSEKLLLEYGTLLQQAHTLQEMNKPTDRDHASISNYFYNNKPLVKADSGFILHKDDLITIRAGRDHAWLDSFVESVLRWYSRPTVKWLFCDEQTRAKTLDPNVHYFSRTRINFVATLIITLLISVLLILPIWILFYLTLHTNGGAGNVALIIVLLSFTLLFNCTLSLFTKIRRHEMLAASVGYCAVLVVFVGNVGNNLPG